MIENFSQETALREIRAIQADRSREIAKQARLGYWLSEAQRHMDEATFKAWVETEIEIPMHLATMYIQFCRSLMPQRMRLAQEQALYDRGQ